jgi:hypothetical protein
MLFRALRNGLFQSLEEYETTQPGFSQVKLAKQRERQTSNLKHQTTTHQNFPNFSVAL